MKSKRIFMIFVFIFIVLVYFFYLNNQDRLPIEDIDITAGTGYDIKNIYNGVVEYSIPISIYVYQDNKTTSVVKSGVEYTIALTRGDRQRRTDKRFLLGQEKAYIISEDAARNGIKNIVDILFTNPDISDTGNVVICKGKAEDVLKYKIDGYPSSADYIYGLVQNSHDFNFFSQNYKLMDIFARMDAEGRHVVLPYIEIKNKSIEITGLAVFKGDKLKSIVDIKKARILNLLRENNVKGTFSIQSTEKDSVDFYCKSKKKVTVEKKDGKLSFNINLTLTGDIVANERYKNPIDDRKEKNKFEEEMGENVEKICNSFVSIMKNECKTDVLDLGTYAIAKFGRHTGTDWDNEVLNSDIAVKVKVKLDREGRGDY